MQEKFKKPHKTAIQRNKLSVPMRYLSENDLLVGRVLDYGCGKGYDAQELDLESYDPYWQTEMPKGKFDTITCNYVLNVVSESIQEEIIKDIRCRLKKAGRAYISVRSDIKNDTNTQRCVYLDESQVQVKGCRMYIIEK